MESGGSDDDDDIFITPNTFREKTASEPDFGLNMFSFLSDGNSDSKATSETLDVDEEPREAQRSNRFYEPIKEQDLAKHVENAVPQATKYKDRWSVKVFEEWQENRNKKAMHDKSIKIFAGAIDEMVASELNDALSFFVFEVKKQDGSDYPANSLFGLVSSIQHYLKMKGKSFRFFNDECFRKLKNSLDAVMKERSLAGIGAHRKKAEIISVSEENTLWEKGILGDGSGKQLVETLVYLFGLHFALRGGNEHRRLRFTNSQIVPGTDSEGTRFLEYREDVSKTNAGGLAHRKVTSKSTRAFENIEDPKRCIVSLYEKYIRLW